MIYLYVYVHEPGQNVSNTKCNMTTKCLQHQNQYMRQHGRGLASSLCIGRGWDGVACRVCGLGELSGPVLAKMREWGGAAEGSRSGLSRTGCGLLCCARVASCVVIGCRLCGGDAWCWCCSRLGVLSMYVCPANV